MARPREELQRILESLVEVNEVWFQPDGRTRLNYPVITYELNGKFDRYADNIKYAHKNRYSVKVIDRDPDSLIPNQVEQLPYSSFDRFYTAAGLNHFVYNLYF